MATKEYRARIKAERKRKEAGEDNLASLYQFAVNVFLTLHKR